MHMAHMYHIYRTFRAALPMVYICVKNSLANKHVFVWQKQFPTYPSMQSTWPSFLKNNNISHHDIVSHIHYNIILSCMLRIILSNLHIWNIMQIKRVCVIFGFRARARTHISSAAAQRFLNRKRRIIYIPYRYIQYIAYM